MPCPNCGSLIRDPIAPGYWRCRAVVPTRMPGPGAFGQQGPHEVLTPVSCRTEYHEAPVGGGAQVSSRCACGTYAIGECAECGTPVCGNCSRMHRGSRLCGVHFNVALQVEQMATARAREEQQAREEELHRAKVRAREQLERELTGFASRLDDSVPGKVRCAPRSGYAVVGKRIDAWSAGTYVHHYSGGDGVGYSAPTPAWSVTVPVLVSRHGWLWRPARDRAAIPARQRLGQRLDVDVVGHAQSVGPDDNYRAALEVAVDWLRLTFSDSL